jgi:hypothetical protein
MAVKKGRLIAIDGTGPSLAAAARDLARTLREATGSGGVSAWDASGIFTDLAAADPHVAVASARTLTLLYAADLAFRVRWHIAPALDAGETVVAVPYIETAKALSIAAGVPKRWLNELFAFAPKPSMCYRAPTARGRVRDSGRAGYSEWFTTAVAANGHGLDPARLRVESTKYLNALEGRRRCRLLTTREVDRLKGRAHRPR